MNTKILIVTVLATLLCKTFLQAQQTPEMVEETGSNNEADVGAIAQGELTDEGCDALANRFKVLDPKASVLPVIGYPGKSGGVCTIIHGMKDMPNMKINGLECKSALCNNALFSTEFRNGKFLNLYEIMVPDVPTSSGDISSAQVYINLLKENGLDVNSSHFHWLGTKIPHIAIHHTSTSMPPDSFIDRTVRAIQSAVKHE